MIDHPVFVAHEEVCNVFSIRAFKLYSMEPSKFHSRELSSFVSSDISREGEVLASFHGF